MTSQRIVHVLARFLVTFVDQFLVDLQTRHEADLMVPSMFSASLGLLSKRCVFERECVCMLEGQRKRERVSECVCESVCVCVC